jgi:hypothetical protein
VYYVFFLIHSTHSFQWFILKGDLTNLKSETYYNVIEDSSQYIFYNIITILE